MLYVYLSVKNLFICLSAVCSRRLRRQFKILTLMEYQATQDEMCMYDFIQNNKQTYVVMFRCIFFASRPRKYRKRSKQE